MVMSSLLILLTHFLLLILNLFIADDIVDADFYILFGGHGHVDLTYMYLTYSLTVFESTY